MMSDLAELSYRLGMTSWQEWQAGVAPAKDVIYGEAGIPVNSPLGPRYVWVIWRLMQMGARQGSQILVRTSSDHVAGLTSAIIAFGLEQAMICVENSECEASDRFVAPEDLPNKPRWSYDFILEFDRKTPIQQSDLTVYSHIGAGGILYVGTDEGITADGSRWHDLARKTGGFCLRQRLPAPFIDGHIEEFWSLDN